jgi:selenocysteine lyase/cysteine desulfurase
MTPAEPEEHAGITTLALPAGVHAQELLERLQERNIQAAVREGNLRLSPHFYCTPGEMETVLGALGEILSTPR